MLATWFVADAANDGLVRVIAPALVAILPGLALTVGAMELAASEIIAGATRLVYGVVQLMLMVFGVAIGMAVAGRSHRSSHRRRRVRGRSTPRSWWSASGSTSTCRRRADRWRG